MLKWYSLIHAFTYLSIYTFSYYSSQLNFKYNQPVNRYGIFFQTWEHTGKAAIQFRKPDGSLYHEELVNTLGFSGIYSNLYYIHQPPPIHQTFQANNLVICSFVPRLFDYHPQAIPAPYNHSNIDSDEVLYYVEGAFMSRKGIDTGSFTLHPGGLPHGPHPGTVEKSTGKRETKEYAVMIDTFRPLKLTQEALKYNDENYPMSWKA